MSDKIVTKLPLSAGQLKKAKNKQTIRLTKDQVSKIGTGTEVRLGKRAHNSLLKAQKEGKGKQVVGGQLGLLAAAIPAIIENLPAIAAGLSAVGSTLGIAKTTRDLVKGKGNKTGGRLVAKRQIPEFNDPNAPIVGAPKKRGAGKMTTVVAKPKPRAKKAGAGSWHVPAKKGAGSWEPPIELTSTTTGSGSWVPPVSFLAK